MGYYSGNTGTMQFKRNAGSDLVFSGVHRQAENYAVDNEYHCAVVGYDHAG